MPRHEWEVIGCPRCNSPAEIVGKILDTRGFVAAVAVRCIVNHDTALDLPATIAAREAAKRVVGRG